MSPAPASPGCSRPHPSPAPRLAQRSIASPLGPLLLVASAEALRGVYFAGHRPAPRLPAELDRDDAQPILALAARELGEYLAGARCGFTVPLQPAGSAFQQAVWAALREIPYGETRSYRDLARRVGRPDAVRAVGAANGRNPLSIIVPCHRVIGAGGALTGYAGGIDNKRWLLALERGDAARADALA